MFSRKDQLIRKTGPEGIGRYDFLKQLVHEFKETNSHECKRQVLANLANFAYDPINYEFMKQLKILNLFLDQLSTNTEEFIHFSLAGLCNLSSDPEFKYHIVRNNGIHLISQYLNHSNENISLNSLTTLIFIYTTECQESVTTPEIIKKVQILHKSENKKFSNLATIFLQDICTSDQISRANQV